MRKYDVTPPNLQRKCNGYGTSFDIHHILSFSKLGLVITRKKIAQRAPLTCSTRLPLSSCMWKTPHQPGPQNIRDGDESGEQQFVDKG